MSKRHSVLHVFRKSKISINCLNKTTFINGDISGLLKPLETARLVVIFLLDAIPDIQPTASHYRKLAKKMLHIDELENGL